MIKNEFTTVGYIERRRFPGQKRSLRRLTVLLAVVLLRPSASCHSGDGGLQRRPLNGSVPEVTGDFDYRAAAGAEWCKGNLHTHSLWSDGDNYPEMIALWYREHGYQFLCFTDHNVLMQKERWIPVDRNRSGWPVLEKLQSAFPAEWVQTRGEGDKTEIRLKTFDEVFDRMAVPGKFLLVQGEEITDRYKNRPIHLCASNVAELFPPLHGDSVVEVMNRNVNRVLARREATGVRTMVHLNHPNFGYAITAEQLMQVSGERFFEVYNGHPSVHNAGDETHASTERMWDIINTWRLSRLGLPLMYGIGTDDGHNYHKTEPAVGSQPGRGWVMVLSDRLDPDRLVEQLESGAFYASSGVTLDRIAWQDGELAIDVAAEEGVRYRIDFIGTRIGFDDRSQPAVEDDTAAAGMTRVYSSDVGAVLKSVEGSSGKYQATGDELYVRAVVTADRLHPNPAERGEFERAWVQPVVVAIPDQGAASN